jgi:hypothetical protein
VAECSGGEVKASELTVEICNPRHARELNAQWHSRLPYTQAGPWMLAFVARNGNEFFGAALWSNPSARTLPKDWFELRRLAVAPNAPHCTCSFMLGKMTRWITKNVPFVTRLISYQDVSVHTGTIYRAAGWSIGSTSKARRRDRSKPRAGTERAYRKNTNGESVDCSAKVRWERIIRDHRREELAQFQNAAGA